MGSRVVPINEAGRLHLDLLAGVDAQGEAEALEDLVIPDDDPIVADLVRLYLSDGEVSNSTLADAGRRCGNVTARTMRNRLNRALDTMRSDTPALGGRWELTSDVLEVIAAFGGRIEPAHRKMQERGVTLPSLRTLHRRWEELSAAFRAFVQSGRAAMLPL